MNNLIELFEFDIILILQVTFLVLLLFVTLLANRFANTHKLIKIIAIIVILITVFTSPMHSIIYLLIIIMGILTMTLFDRKELYLIGLILLAIGIITSLTNLNFIKNYFFSIGFISVLLAFVKDLLSTKLYE